MGIWGLDTKNTLFPEIETLIHQTRTIEENNSLHEVGSQNNFEIKNEKMSPSDYMVAFSVQSESYCIGLVDMVDSTKISANLHERDWCKYYSIFLNSMAKILPRFGGHAIKNGGDSLLYYFPESNKLRNGLVSCLECSLTMIEAQSFISKKTQEEGLPPLNFRVSADYGRVVFMKSNNSTSVDPIGPPVNMCAKINHRAQSNAAVIGGDLYQITNDLVGYRFSPISGLSIGLKYTYPIYALTRKR